MQWQTVEQVKEELKKSPHQYYKYIRIGNEFRFISIEIYGGSHTQMVQEGETPVSAGFVKFTYDNTFFTEGYSSTLNLGRADDDDTLLGSIFNLPRGEPW
jgi:hypothetical protein